MIKSILILLVPCLLLAGVSSVEAQYYLELDTNSILIGEQLNLRGTFKLDADHDTAWFAFEESDNMELISFESVFNQDSIFLKAVLTAWDTGIAEIDFVRVVIPKEEGDLDSISMPIMRVGVSTFAIDTTQGIFDIKQPIDTPFSIFELFPELAYVFIGILVLFIGLYFLIFRRKRLRELHIEQEDPLVRARRILNEIEEKSIWKDGLIKEHYDQLSDCLRHFIGARLNISAMEMTTDELEEMLISKRVPAKELELLKPLLRASDMAKFAKGDPGQGRHVAYMADARSLLSMFNEFASSQNNEVEE